MSDPARRDPFGEDVRTEAAEWFARMRGSDADRLRPEFQAWRAAEPANAEAYERHLQNWERSAFLANTGLAGRRDLRRIARKPLHRRFAFAASVAALLTGGSAILLLQTPSALSARLLDLRVVTADGRRVIALDDDTKITVEARSALDLSFSPRQRRARLERGRVRFELPRPDPRPLVVDVPHGRVVTDQASFDVALEGDKVSVTTIQGAVMLQQPGATDVPPRRLEAGDQAVLAGSASGATVSDAGERRSSAGMIVFTGEPVAVAVERFNRMNRRPITLGSADMGAHRISGAFRADDPEGFAEAVVAMFGGRVDVAARGPIVIRSSSRARKIAVG